MTRMIDTHIPDYDGNKILVGGDDIDYIVLFEFELIKFRTEDKNIAFTSSYG